MNKVEPHPALKDFPHTGYPEFQLSRLFGTTVNAIDLSLSVLKGKTRPILWGQNVADTKTPVANFPLPQEFFHGGIVTELKVGKGRLIHCGLWIIDGLRRDLPEAKYLLDCLVDYTSGNPAEHPIALTRAEAESLFRVE